MPGQKLSPEAEKQLAELSMQLAHNPKTRAKYVKLVQEIDPSKRFPDVETDDIREEMNTRFAEQAATQQAERVRQQLETQRAGLITSGRFQEEDVKKIETDIMPKYGLTDYDAAATLYAAQTKPQTPVPEIKGRTWEMPLPDKKDMGNLANYARKQAYAAIDEIRNRRVS